MSVENGDRLQQIQTELAAGLEDRMAELDAALKASEATTRRIITIETELARHRAEKAHYEQDMASLESTLTTSSEQIESLRARAKAATTGRSAHSDEALALEAEIQAIDAETETLRERITTLQTEARTLRDENTTLKRQLRTLEDNVAQMQAAKAELRSSLSAMTAKAHAVTLSND